MSEPTSTDSAGGDSAGDAASGLQPDIRIVRGNPSAEELAAVTAVVSGVLEELAEERGRELTVGTTAWQRSQKAPRKQIHAGHGQWRSFAG